MGHYHLLLLAVYAGAAVAAAQVPQRAPSPASDTPVAETRRNVSDAQLGLEVQVQLFQELNVSNLSSIVRHGVATLDGMVNSETERRRAEEIALTVPGVTSVVNELRVADASIIALANDAAALAERETSRIETAVTERLSSDPTLGSRSITVEADDLTNTVTLTGSVSTEEEKERAGQLAVSAFPAGRVRNQVEVRQRL
jgi:osmotically-inducible protein OsmY